MNITGVFLCAKAFLRHLTVVEKPGAVVNFASTLGVTAAPNRAAYTASKHAVIGLTKQMALKVGETGIRVNFIGQGVARTSLMERYFKEAAISETVGSLHAMKRWDEAEEISKAIRFWRPTMPAPSWSKRSSSMAAGSLANGCRLFRSHYSFARICSINSSRSWPQ